MPSSSLPFALRVRRRGNWLNLSTPVGLLIARASGARVRRGPRGLLFAEGYRWTIPRAGAFTVGNVVLTRSSMDALERLHPGVTDHENEHAWQYLWLLGLPFLPVYAALSGWSWLRTGDPASANALERQAGLEIGGYVEAPRTNAGMRRLRDLARRRGRRLRP